MFLHLSALFLDVSGLGLDTLPCNTVDAGALPLDTIDTGALPLDVVGLEA